jgi:hypothetical protein
MFSPSTLRELAKHDTSPKVSMFLPTSPSSATTQDAATHLKNLLREAMQMLERAGASTSEAEALLADVSATVSDREFWQHQQHGLAFFVSPDGVVQVSVSHSLEPAVSVGDHFDVLPLMPGLVTNSEYALVCASQGEVSVYRGNAAELVEITIPEMPTSLEDVLTDTDYENPVLASPPARPNTGSQNISNAQVYGDAPPEWQAMVRRKFAGKIVSGLSAASDLQGLPLVVIADEDMAGDVAEEAGAVAVDMTHPTALSVKQRHDVSWGLVQETLDQTRQDRLATMAQRLGQNNDVATDPAEIVQMAKAGRVDKLFVATNSPDAVISDALWSTLGNGGEVFYAGDSDAMPDSGVVALLRY